MNTTIIDQKYFKDKDYNVFTLDIMPMNQETWESEIKDDWIEINKEEMLYLTQPPSFYHELIDGKWVITEEKAEQKRQDIIEKNTADREALRLQAESDILILERKIKFKLATTEDAERLDLLYRYTITLYDLDMSQENITWPEKPE